MDWLVFGLLCVACAAVLLPGALRDARAQRMRRLARGAHEVRGQLQAIFSGEHAMEVSRPGAIGDLDERWYDRAQAELEAQGFRPLGDFEDRTLNEAMPAQRTRIRALLGDGGATIASLSHLRVRGGLRVLAWLLRQPRDIRAVELTSLAHDGVWLLTNDVQGHARLPFPPSFRFESHPAGTPVGRLVARHRARGAERDAALVEHGDADEVLASIARQWREASGFFRGRGGLRRDEWQRLLGRPAPEDP